MNRVSLKGFLTSDRLILATAVLFSASLVFLPAAGAKAEETSRKSKVFFSLPQEGISVDGNLSDWNRSKPLLLSKDNCFMRNGNTTDTAKVYSNFNGDYLYFAVEVNDNDVIGPDSSDQIFKNDGIELWFDCRLDSDTSDMFRQDDDCQIIITYTTDGKMNTPQPGLRIMRTSDDVHFYADSKIASMKTPTGYILEIGLPIQAFQGLKTGNGNVIGFNISLCDREAEGFHRLLWSGENETDPRQFGFLVFGQPKNPAKIHTAMSQAKKVRAGKAMSNDESNDDKPKVDRKTYTGSPRIVSVTPNASSVGRYEKFELSCDILVQCENPYDFDDVLVQAQITTPSGEKVLVDGFYFEPYDCAMGVKYADCVVPMGYPTWNTRYAPTELGEYSSILRVRDRKGRTAHSEPVRFQVTESDSSGFLRVSKRDPHYLEFDNGKAFFGIGYGMHQWNSSNIDLRENKRHLTEIAFFGGNYTSVNLCTAGDGPFNLENPQTGLRRYNQAAAAKFDTILEATRRRGVYIIPNLVQTAIAHAPYWQASRFNIKNGGPCKTPEEFFTHPQALELTRRRFRYTVARWGYSTNILGWELFNEVNYTDGFQKNIDSVRTWHKDMARYLKEHDASRHMVSTSFGSGDGCEDSEIWSLPEIDFLITHSYSTEPVDSIKLRMRRKDQYGKPNIGGEWGVKFPACDTIRFWDREGTFLHNGLWLSVVTRQAGNILFWWMYRYHDTLDLLEQFRHLHNYVQGIDFPSEGFEPVELAAERNSKTGRRVDLVVPTKPFWGVSPYKRYLIDPQSLWGVTHEIDERSNDPRVVEALNKGQVNELPALLFGREKKDFQQDLVMTFTAEQPTKIVIPLLAVQTSGARLEVLLDDTSAMGKDVRDSDGKNNPNAKELTDTIAVPVPAGVHTLAIRNTGSGWVRLGEITLKDFSQADIVKGVTVLGMKGKNLSLLWFYNKQHNWYLKWKNGGPIPLETFRDVSAMLKDMPNGAYQVEWWDTWKGKAMNTQEVTTRDHILTVTAPPFDKDVACKIIKMGNDTERALQK